MKALRRISRRLTRAGLRFVAWLAGAGILATLASVLAVWFLLVPKLPPTEMLRDVRFQVPLRIYSREGELLGEFGEKRRVPLWLPEIPSLLVKAVLASEDEHFYTHPGVDWRGLTRAVVHILRTGRKGPGGSTITMQVARNFFLGREKTYLRKLNEILLALKIERELTKNEILELYLNKIFLGNRAYGVGAAAEVYYGKPVNELNVPELAMIAGLPQRPSDYNPIVNPQRAKIRRNHVLERMRVTGALDEEQEAAARAAPITASLHRPTAALNAPYVAEMARVFTERWFGKGAYTEGYQVQTTVSSRLQRTAGKALRDGLLAYGRRHGYRGPESRLTLPLEPSESDLRARLADLRPIGGLRPAIVLEVREREAKIYVRGHGDALLSWEGLEWARPYIYERRRGRKPKKAADILHRGDIIRVSLSERENGAFWSLSQVPKIEGALVSLDPRDGALLALAGGFDFYRSKFNRATQARRQPGSNFKPFIYSAALAKGFTAASLINDSPIVFDDPGLEKEWRPENYSGKFFGPTRLRVGLTKSRNLVSIRLLREIGIDFAFEHIRKFGFDVSRLPKSLSLALGSGALTPLELARGYATLANGGYGVEPYLVARIVDARGQERYRARPPTVCRSCPQPEASPAPEGSTPAVPGTATAGNATATPGVHADAPPPDSPVTANQGALPVARRAVDEQNIWLIDSILRDVIRYGTGRRARVLKRKDIAGKTGTTNDQFDAWFSGFVPRLLATVWVGFDQAAPLGRGETGARAALPIWIDYMREGLKGIPEHIPERPDGLVTVRIDPNTGQLAKGGSPHAIFETFRAARVPKPGPSGSERTTPGASETDKQGMPRGPASEAGDGKAARSEGTTERLF